MANPVSLTQSTSNISNNRSNVYDISARIENIIKQDDKLSNEYQKIKDLLAQFTKGNNDKELSLSQTLDIKDKIYALVKGIFIENPDLAQGKEQSLIARKVAAKLFKSLTSSDGEQSLYGFVRLTQKSDTSDNKVDSPLLSLQTTTVNNFSGSMMEQSTTSPARDVQQGESPQQPVESPQQREGHEAGLSPQQNRADGPESPDIEDMYKKYNSIESTQKESTQKRDSIDCIYEEPRINDSDSTTPANTHTDITDQKINPQAITEEEAKQAIGKDGKLANKMLLDMMQRNIINGNFDVQYIINYVASTNQYNNENPNNKFYMNFTALIKNKAFALLPETVKEEVQRLQSEWEEYQELVKFSEEVRGMAGDAKEKFYKVSDKMAKLPERISKEEFNSFIKKALVVQSKYTELLPWYHIASHMRFGQLEEATQQQIIEYTRLPTSKP